MKDHDGGFGTLRHTEYELVGVEKGRPHAHVIRRECFAFENDLMPPVDTGLVESTQEKVKVSSKRLHHRYFSGQSSHDGENVVRSGGIDMQPCWQRRFGKTFKVTKDSL